MSALPPLDELFPQLERDADGFLDLRGRDLSGRSFDERSLVRVRFAASGEDAEPANLTGVSFRSSKLENVRFPRVQLDRNDFRGAELFDCDFRYVGCARSTFADSTIEWCDFYRAYFEATVFSRAELTRVSLDRAWLQGAIDLDRTAFEGPRDGPALVHEADAETYWRFLEPTAPERLARTASGDSIRDRLPTAVRNRRLRAAETYRSLSAVWTSAGQFDDATFAYIRGKELQRQHLRARLAERLHGRRPADDTRRGVLRDLGGFLGLSVARLVCNYGDSLGRIVLLVLALVLGFGTIYWASGAVESDAGATIHAWPTCVLFSLEQVTTLTSPTLQPAGRAVELLGSLQTLIGVALLGLFGFVLGNKIRNS